MSKESEKRLVSVSQKYVNMIQNTNSGSENLKNQCWPKNINKIKEDQFHEINKKKGKFHEISFHQSFKEFLNFLT